MLIDAQKSVKPHNWDHVMPKSRGGTHDWTNLVRSCKKCNSGKGNCTLEEYRARLAKAKGVSIEQFKFHGELGLTDAL